MFRENNQHLQFDFLDPFQQMGEKMRQRLEESWAGTFYREIFCRIDETPFAVLYSDQPSRPNAAINALVGAEILKAGFGWSDEELWDQLQFNLQARFALGLRNMSVMPFEMRTVYNFRQRVSRHMQESGENLIEQVFVQVTDEQLAALELKTGHQRMDSVLVASNIRQMSRLQLLVEVVQRVWRMLTEADQGLYATSFEPYLKGTAGQYCYRVKADEVDDAPGSSWAVDASSGPRLAADYADHPTYQVLQRVFDEHFAPAAGDEAESDQIRVKAGEELSASSLQSPDDWEATYRVKRGEGHQGYVSNLTETCDPENDVQLITMVQVAPNTTDDEQFLVEGLPELKERTDLDALWTDGGYTGPDAEDALRQEQVEHIPTNLRGRRTAPDRLGLETFSWEIDADGTPVTVTCPGGQKAEVRTGRKAGRFVAYLDQPGCETCPFAEGCPARPMKRRDGRSLNVSLAPGASRVAASAGCQNTWQGQQLASSDREHGSQCYASVWWTNWQAARPWSDSSHAGLDLLGSDGQCAPNLAPRAAVGAKQEPGSGFFVVSLLFAPEILGSCAQFAPFFRFRSCVVRKVSYCKNHVSKGLEWWPGCIVRYYQR